MALNRLVSTEGLEGGNTGSLSGHHQGQTRSTLTLSWPLGWGVGRLRDWETQETGAGLEESEIQIPAWRRVRRTPQGGGASEECAVEFQALSGEEIPGWALVHPSVQRMASMDPCDPLSWAPITPELVQSPCLGTFLPDSLLDTVGETEAGAKARQDEGQAGLPLGAGVPCSVPQLVLTRLRPSPLGSQTANVAMVTLAQPSQRSAMGLQPRQD